MHNNKKNLNTKHTNNNSNNNNNINNKNMMKRTELLLENDVETTTPSTSSSTTTLARSKSGTVRRSKSSTLHARTSSAVVTDLDHSTTNTKTNHNNTGSGNSLGLSSSENEAPKSGSSQTTAAAAAITTATSVGVKTTTTTRSSSSTNLLVAVAEDSSSSKDDTSVSPAPLMQRSLSNSSISSTATFSKSCTTKTIPNNTNSTITTSASSLISRFHHLSRFNVASFGGPKETATPTLRNNWLERMALSIAIVAWFTVGVLAIVTTKILLTEWNVPPIVLTTQQLCLGSWILQMVITVRDGGKDGIQPWPWQTAPAQQKQHSDDDEVKNANNTMNVESSHHQHQMEIGKSGNTAVVKSDSTTDIIKIDNSDHGHYHHHHHHHGHHHGHHQSSPRIILYTLWRTFTTHSNFILAGVFFSLDFLFSNSAFRMSAASFVETVKASDPICTTAIALLFKVDRLGPAEGASLALLVVGVLLSTYGNSVAESTTTTTTTTTTANDIDTSTELQQQVETEEIIIIPTEPSSAALWESFVTAATVTAANLCFAFRAMNQKRYRSKTPDAYQMDDVNLLCRMLQIGAIFLMIPVVVLHGMYMIRSIQTTPMTFQLSYLGLSAVNSVSYATYNLASTYVLSKLTVLHHSSLNCLRRMGAILATSIFFGVPMTMEAISGLFTSFFGFAGFTYYRHKRLSSSSSIKST